MFLDSTQQKIIIGIVIAIAAVFIEMVFLRLAFATPKKRTADAVEKPAVKTTEKRTVKTTEKPAVKTTEKTTVKTTEKTTVKTTSKDAKTSKVILKTDNSFFEVVAIDDSQVKGYTLLEATRKYYDAKFDGWYDENGKLLSKEDSFYIETSNRVITAKSHLSRENADGLAVKCYEWKYRRNLYTLTWNVKNSQYYDCLYRVIARFPLKKQDYVAFVDYKSEAIKSVSSELERMSSGMNAVERANFVLKFVQNSIRYVVDKNDGRHFNMPEYWKFPVETLFEYKGNSEDTSVLYCALMKAMGEKTALLIFSGRRYLNRRHCAAGIAVPGAKGDYYEYEGVKYFYCETTTSNYNVGQRTEGYLSAKIYVIPD